MVKMSDEERYWRGVKKAREEYEANRKTFAEHYRAGREAERDWERQARQGELDFEKHPWYKNYVDPKTGRWKFAKENLRQRDAAIYIAERDIPDRAVMHTRFWSPEDTLEDRFRRQKGKRRKKRGKKKACKGGMVGRAIDASGIKKLRL